MDFKHLRNIREYELQQTLPLLPAPCPLLEIGAGAGWQALALAQRGFQVSALDVAGSGYVAERVWPVLLYDGVTIPAPNASFDVVFSSNVLEHIPHVEQFQAEIKRVLKPGGVAVHVLPSGSWRFWTNLAYYVPILRRTLHRLRRRLPLDAPLAQSTAAPSSPAAAARAGFLPKLRKIILPHRHGERGDFISEIYLFSRPGWSSLFRRSGWRIVACRPNRLFYTGYAILGSRLSLRARRLASFALGSSGLIYVLADDGAPAPVGRDEQQADTSPDWRQ